MKVVHSWEEFFKKVKIYASLFLKKPIIPGEPFSYLEDLKCSPFKNSQIFSDFYSNKYVICFVGCGRDWLKS